MDSSPCSEKDTYFWGFYTDINKLEMSVYKIGDISKVVQSPFEQSKNQNYLPSDGFI